MYLLRSSTEKTASAFSKVKKVLDFGRKKTPSRKPDWNDAVMKNKFDTLPKRDGASIGLHSRNSENPAKIKPSTTGRDIKNDAKWIGSKVKSAYNFAKKKAPGAAKEVNEGLESVAKGAGTRLGSKPVPKGKSPVSLGGVLEAGGYVGKKGFQAGAYLAGKGAKATKYVAKKGLGAAKWAVDANMKASKNALTKDVARTGRKLKKTQNKLKNTAKEYEEKLVSQKKSGKKKLKKEVRKEEKRGDTKMYLGGATGVGAGAVGATEYSRNKKEQ